MELIREVIQHDPQESLRAFERVEAQFPAAFHVHAEYELTMITRGRGLCFVGDQVRAYEAPDLVLVGSELPHTWQSTGPGPHAALVAQWHPLVAPGLGTGLPEGRRIASLLERSRSGLSFTSAEAEVLQADFHTVVGLSGLSRWLAFIALLDRCSGCSCRAISTAVQQQTDPRLAGLLRWLQDHAEERISLRDAAEELGLGREATARFIRRYTGNNFSDLLHRLRLTRACDALASTSERIADIAFGVGFNSLAQFNRLFLRHFGMTPRAWRRSFHAGSGTDQQSDEAKSS